MYMMMKHLHLTAVGISILFFVVRFVWKQMQSPIIAKKWVKILPHVIDTILLGSAITLCVILSQYPFVNQWLTLKLAGIIAYIVFGMAAMKWANTKMMQWGAFFAAVASVLLTAHVALSR